MAEPLWGAAIPNLDKGLSCGHNNHMRRKSPKKVGARELKTRLGTYLRQVREGTTIIVTERGEPIAELRPLSKAAARTDKGRLDELVAVGALTRKSEGRLASFVPIPAAGEPVSETIVKDREERF